MLIAGTDEVGRGPLAGPVTAAAVILPQSYDLPGLTDSKKLTEKKRDKLFDLIKAQAVSYAIAEASVEEIDRLNILQASLLAMHRAVSGLNKKPEKVLIDGNICPDWGMAAEAIVGGDQLIPAISAASILAKVTRDRLMIQLDAEYPGYGFAGNKGYPTKKHLQALQEIGLTPWHRRSFAPVKKLLKSHEYT